ncbi:unnamed protein product [Paramecium pentaurelia]|uniref:Uncharacterized protein n=1 Tax=Paramecium pentaurelia TaxID=43138 RepID=A0A8S1XT44_9CILI|nr:unnamed protein product [Paramecium pentaurelia]
MILLILLVYKTYQTLIYQFHANSNIRDEWQDYYSNVNFYTCGGIQYFGQPNNNGNSIVISRIFLDLEPHSHIIVDAQFLTIDNNQSPYFYIDQQSISYQSVISSQLCGNTQFEKVYTISITHQHNRRTVWIYIINYYAGGLISLKLSMIKCQYECAGCIENYHTFCLQWKLHQYSFNQKLITNSDGWTFVSSYSYLTYSLCGNCQFLYFQQIKYSTELPPHQDVLIRFFKLWNTIIIVDYLYGKQIISSNNQQIEILIRNHDDPILLLNIKTQLASDYSYIRDFEVFYTQAEIMFNNLNEGCLYQIDDKCLICQEGWIQDEFLENCHPICGDGIIQGQEQCDHGNLISNHSCYLCQYSCQQFCSICQIGICQQCQDGFVINPNFNCDPLCGDGNLIPYSNEQCELTVNGVLDGCQECRYISIENCKISYNSICLKCEVGFYIQENLCFPYCGDKLILELYEDCDDGNLQPYDGCFNCKFQCIEDCNICERGQCLLKCEVGYEFINNSCLSVCGDQIITKEEDCDDGNLQPHDGCFNCKYSCPKNCFDCYQGTCLECNYQYQLISNQCKQQLNCGDGLLQEEEDCDDGNYQAADGCKDCRIEQNWICTTRDSLSLCTFVKAPNLVINYLNMTQNKQYISIQFNQKVKIYTAQPLSETINFEISNIDKKNWNSSLYIIQDVGSDVSFGEFIFQIEIQQLLEFRPVLKIKVSCQQFCSICQIGICQQCQDGFVINPNFNCDPLCGDGNLIPYSNEQCELTVNGVLDGCQECRYISIENCKISYNSICLKCEVGFYIQENLCFPYCGDKLILELYEDCDDGNLQPYDGCFNCKFQCIEDCNICERGQCLLKCEVGYEFINNSCLSVCGDQIITKEEDCDDGNLQPHDGCFNCKYSCPKNCFDCYQGTCLECNYQYQLISNQCKQQLNCGDGLLQEEEDCDDGNYQAADGCKDCRIEQNWICTTRDSLSLCTFVKAPNLVINYLNMTQNKQYISIQFNQKVKIYTAQPLSETINFEISNIDKKNWNSSLYIIQDVGSDVSFGEFIFQIEIQQLLEFRPVLKIKVNQTVANIDDAILDNVEKSITLQYPKFLDETQKDYSQNLKNLNKYIIYCLSGVTGLSLLLGNGDLFVELMAILQFQQYLRYINLQYPQNIEIYFTFNDMITIQPLLDFIYFPKLLKFIDIQQNQAYSDGKFNVYKQSYNLIINLSCQIFQLLIFLVFILLFQWIKKGLYKWIFCSRYFYYMSSLSLYINPKVIFKFSQSFYNICMELLKLKKFMSFQGLQKAIFLNGWDMIFKTLLYTRNIETKNYIDIVQIIIASIILILYFTIFLSFFKGNSKLSKKNNYQMFEILSFVRQFFFLLFLIYVQSSQILQLGLLLMTSILQIRFLFNYRCIFNQKNYIVQMVVEISVLTFILSSFLYIQEFNKYFNEEKKILLGWIQAIILSKGIIIELIWISIDLLQKIKKNNRRQSQIVKNPLFS